MELIDGECRERAGKKHSSCSFMVIKRWRSMVSAGMERGRSKATA